MNFSICMLVSILILKLANDNQSLMKNNCLKGRLHEGKQTPQDRTVPFDSSVSCLGDNKH